MPGAEVASDGHGEAKRSHDHGGVGTVQRDSTGTSL